MCTLALSRVTTSSPTQASNFSFAELEGQEEAKGNSEEMTSSLHGDEACCKVVDFAPTNHRGKREMPEKD
jgi:hypothetical protein